MNVSSQDFLLPDAITLAEREFGHLADVIETLSIAGSVHQPQHYGKLKNTPNLYN